MGRVLARAATLPVLLLEVHGDRGELRSQTCHLISLWRPPRRKPIGNLDSEMKMLGSE